MLQSYEAIIEKGQIKWIDAPPIVNNARVIVTILPSEKDNKDKPRRLGFMKGQITVPDDIHWGDDDVARLFGID